jgi:hypothetical protein
MFEKTLKRPNPSDYIVLQADNLKLLSASIRLASSIDELNENKGDTMHVTRLYRSGSLVALGLDQGMKADLVGVLSVEYESQSWPWKFEHDLYGTNKRLTKDLLSNELKPFPRFDKPNKPADVQLGVVINPSRVEVASNMHDSVAEMVDGTELRKIHYKMTTNSIAGKEILVRPRMNG